MPRCPSCHAINSGNATVCVRCGKSFDVQDQLYEPSIDPEAPHPLKYKEPPEYSISDPAYSDSVVPDKIPSETSIWDSDAESPSSGSSALDQFSSHPTDLSSGRSTAPAPEGLFAGEANPVSTIVVESEYPTRLNVAPGIIADAVLSEYPRHFGVAPALTGDVFALTERPEEPPDFDVFIWLSRLFGVTLILGLIILLVGHAYHRFGVILMGIIVLALFLLSRFLGGIFLISLFGLGRLLGSIFRANGQQVPVMNLRVMDDEQREHIVRIKGRIIRGDIAQYDRVAIWGQRRGGTLVFRRGYNLRAESWIQIEGRYTWILALLLGLLNVWLFFELSRVYPGWFLWGWF
ncbi:MAG: zinc ribbon domain-containing protein [Pseudomonadota bacterium]